MTVLTPRTVQAFWAELEKLAGTRALKEVRRVFRTKGSREADVLARRFARKGALKSTDVGSQIRLLGAGVEGPAVVTVGQRAGGGGVAVRKQLEPSGYLYSPEIVKRKFEVGQELRGNPGFARLLSKEIGERGGAPFTHYSLVEGTPGTQVVEDLAHQIWFPKNVKNARFPGLQKLRGVAKGLRGQAGLGLKLTRMRRTSKKYVLTDLAENPGNWMMTPRGPVALDYIPLTAAEEARKMKAFAQIDPFDRRNFPVHLREAWSKVGPFSPPAGMPEVVYPPKSLRRLGPGSRQVPKQRGAKPPALSPAERIKRLRERYGR